MYKLKKIHENDIWKIFKRGNMSKYVEIVTDK
jgi:hypothetical protein